MDNWLDRLLTKKEIKELEKLEKRTSFMLNASLIFFITFPTIVVIKVIFF